MYTSLPHYTHHPIGLYNVVLVNEIDVLIGTFAISLSQQII